MEPALVGTLLDGKFRIDAVLGSGASGDVYAAVNVALGARVAVKVLKPGHVETADVRRQRFLREARVAAQLESEHVVRVFDVVAPAAGPAYLVMELLTGETLAERLQREGRLAVRDAVDLVMQAATPLAELHDAGIVHRDVKPSNLFLCRDRRGREAVKLIDFGVAAFREASSAGAAGDAADALHARPDASLTSTEVLVGTPQYMAPEQVRRGGEVDARTDVWALGVTLYVLLAGEPPFDGQTVLALLGQIERDEPAALSTKRADVPAGLARVVHRCLSKPPEGRPADARALLAALAPYGPRAASRRPVALAAAVAGVAIAIVAVAATRAGGRSAQPPAAAGVAAASVAPPAEASSVATVAQAAPPAAASASAPSAPAGTSATGTRSAPSAPPRRASAPQVRAPSRPPRALPDDDRIE